LEYQRRRPRFAIAANQPNQKRTAERAKSKIFDCKTQERPAQVCRIAHIEDNMHGATKVRHPARTRTHAHARARTHARTHDARTHARTGSKNVNESIRRSGDGQEFELEDGMSCRQASETPTTGKQQQ
jgi:hypothetical protein